MLSDKDFYERVYFNLEEIHNLPISFEEKRELEYSFYELIKTYEENKEPVQKNFDITEKNIDLLKESLYKIRDGIVKGNTENARIASINAKIAKAHIDEYLEKVGEIKVKKGIKIEKLERKIEAKKIAVNVIKGMKEQI